jgi:hypothetical protein
LNDPSLNLSENPHFDEAKTKGYLCFGEIWDENTKPNFNVGVNPCA